MSEEKMTDALMKLKEYFNTTVPEGRLPQIVFHGSEPLLNKEALFKVIERFKNDFVFGIQTNAALLEDADIDFLKSTNVAIGISIDGHTEELCDKTRRTWDNKGSFRHLENIMKKLTGYKSFSVICTLTEENIKAAPDIVEYFHKNGVEVCLLNILRCTQPYSRKMKPDEDSAAAHFIKALERSYELFRETGRKIVIGNFANILLGIMAPTARHLMCDISPCGGGRCFFAVSAKGDVFPCSEFIGLEEFNAGNIFDKSIPELLDSEAVNKVTSRMVENIDPCKKCAIRHFCGSPCPAEAFNMNGGRDAVGAFCRFYEEQTRYAFRLIADGKQDAFLLDGWDKETEKTFDWTMMGS